MKPDIKEAQAKIGILKNPFDSSKMIGMMIHCYMGFGGWNYNGKVSFKNGDTEGEQKFQGESVADVLHKIEEFMESLG